MSDPNPTLWWMLARADEIMGGDARVRGLISEYEAKWLQPGAPMHEWRAMFHWAPLSDG